MKLLLPYRFKKIGNIIAPLGIAMWVVLQLDMFKPLFIQLFGRGQYGELTPPYIVAGIVMIILSFFLFLAGVYFIIFSKERVEDEMIQKVRSESFQFAALLQIVFIILGFLSMLILGEPEREEEVLEAFFGGCIFIFWLSFICRLRYVLRQRLK
jgi:hypothetical protein